MILENSTHFKFFNSNNGEVTLMLYFPIQEEKKKLVKTPETNTRELLEHLFCGKRWSDGERKGNKPVHEEREDNEKQVQNRQETEQEIMPGKTITAKIKQQLRKPKRLPDPDLWWI